jgi:hypothetical protein
MDVDCRSLRHEYRLGREREMEMAKRLMVDVD